MTVVGFVHPGQMGASIAADASGERLWCSAGRSAETAARAANARLEPCETLGELVQRSHVIVSVCPPAEATNVASAVSGCGFDGIYVDVNAIAPATARSIAEQFDRFVDGGIVGPPVSGPESTRLYLSGSEAETVAQIWASGHLDVRLVPGEIGAASAVKMCFATWTKVGAAMLLNVRALAEAEGVTESLLAEWETSMPDLAQRSERNAQGVAPKAWRFVGEMEQIAAAYRHAGLPDGFAHGATDIYRKLADFKNLQDVSLGDVLDSLIDQPSSNGG